MRYLVSYSRASVHASRSIETMSGCANFVSAGGSGRDSSLPFGCSSIGPMSVRVLLNAACVLRTSCRITRQTIPISNAIKSMRKWYSGVDKIFQILEVHFFVASSDTPRIYDCSLKPGHSSGPERLHAPHFQV